MYEIYTDGACIGNGLKKNIGGWGYVVVKGGQKIFEEVFTERNTTNNRQEMKAVLNAINYCLISEFPQFVITSDSQYVVNGFNDWMHNWAKKGFMKGQKEIPNADLWRELFTLKKLSKTPISLKWVRGHDGNKWNEYIDKAIEKKLQIPHQHTEKPPEPDFAFTEYVRDLF